MAHRTDPLEMLEALWDIPVIDVDLECELCGCTELDACEGGCGWSLKHLEAGRAVCTRCENQLLTLRVNMGALGMWRRGGLIQAPQHAH